MEHQHPSNYQLKFRLTNHSVLIQLCRMAYIDFKDQDSVSKALELSGSDIGGGYELYVDEAKPRGDGQRGGGRSGGRSGGRFGDRSGGRRGGGRFGERSGGRDGGGRFGGRRGGRDGGRGRGGRGFGNKHSAGTPSAGTTHPVIVKFTAFWFEQKKLPPCGFWLQKA
jgi:nucleolin